VIRLGPADAFHRFPAVIGEGLRTYFLLKQETGFILLSNICPHGGGSVDDKGTCFECPLHGWQFDRRTGRCLNEPDRSLTEFPVVVEVAGTTSKDEVNELFRSKADTGDLEGILQYSDEPLVSTDVVHSSYSAIFDSDLTMVNGNLVKVFGWYDNEWGYSCRLVDLVVKIAKTMPAVVAA